MVFCISAALACTRLRLTRLPHRHRHQAADGLFFHRFCGHYRGRCSHCRCHELSAQRTCRQSPHLHTHIPALITYINIHLDHFISRSTARCVTHPRIHLRRARRDDPQRFQRKRHSQLHRVAVSLIHQSNTRLQRSIHQARMQNIIPLLVFCSSRHTQLGQYLPISAINRSDRLERGPITQSHPRKHGIQAVRLPLAFPHFPLELLKIYVSGRGSLAPHRPPLTMHHLRFLLLLCLLPLLLTPAAVNLVLNLLVLIRHQRNVHLPRSADHQWLCPHRMPQFQQASFRSLRPSLLHCRPRPPQIRHPGHHLLPTLTTP